MAIYHVATVFPHLNDLTDYPTAHSAAQGQSPSVQPTPLPTSAAELQMVASDRPRPAKMARYEPATSLDKIEAHPEVTPPLPAH